jgi:hypothetical protein
VSFITIKIERRPAGARTTRSRRSRNLRIAAVSGAGALAAAMLLNLPSSAASVVAITPHTLQNNTTVGANKSVSPVVLGGATTVPTDATRVRMSVSFTGKANGALLVYPANSSGIITNGLPVPFTANQNVAVGLTPRIGIQNKITFLNQSSSTLVLTVKITGYSTDIDSTDVTGRNGSPGEVLTNTGLGADWEPVSHAYAAAPTGFVPVGRTSTLVASLTVPAGSYMATFSGTLFATNASESSVSCSLWSPSLGGASSFEAIISGYSDSPMMGQALISTSSSGPITVICNDNLYGASEMGDMHLIATTMGAVSGAVLH